MSTDSRAVPLPARADLPFFAYGVFKPGQLAYHTIRDLVRIAAESSIAGSLRIRDGLPILDVQDTATVRGYIIQFDPERTHEAYSRIANLETERQYHWPKPRRMMPCA